MSNALIIQLNNPVMMQQISRRLAAAASVLLIVGCAWLLVEITWMFLPQADETLLPIQKKAQPLNSQNQQNSFKKLTSANVFGVSEKAITQKQTKVPETRLNLTLKGVLAATPMKLASAIIAKGKNGKEDIYGIGDKMQGGVSIKEIHPEYIVLVRNGKLETLKLQKVSGIGGLGASKSSSSRFGSSRGSPAAALKQIRTDILKNPTSFGKYALPVVVKENGKQVGYRLQPQEQGQLLAELGIQKNDVITEINGVKLDRPQNGISALRKLSTAKNLAIVVKRNGVEVPLNISLQ